MRHSREFVESLEKQIKILERMVFELQTNQRSKLGGLISKIDELDVWDIKCDPSDLRMVAHKDLQSAIAPYRSKDSEQG